MSSIFNTAHSNQSAHMSTPADADDARQQRKREAARLRKQQWRSNPANAEAFAAETEAARVRMQERRSDPANAEGSIDW